MPKPALPDDSALPCDPVSDREMLLGWAKRSLDDPAMAAADWLTDDIVRESGGTSRGALALLSDPTTPLATLRAAKDAFKAMRVMGQTAADRRLGARLYLGAIAAGIAFHGERITAQRSSKVRSALKVMRDDPEAPDAVRHVATVALRRTS